MDWRVVWAIGSAALVGLPLVSLLLGRRIAARKASADAADAEHQAPVSADPSFVPPPSPTRAGETPTPAEPLILDRMPRLGGGFIALILFTLFWNGVLSVFLYEAVGSLVRSIVASQQFFVVEGEITKAGVDVRSGDGDGGPSYLPKFQYHYVVDDHPYTGTRYAFGEVATGNREWAHDVVDAKPVGSKVTVYYNPSDPSDAVLNTGMMPGNRFMLLFIQPFFLIGMAMLGATIWWPINVSRLRKWLDTPDREVTFIPTWGPIRRDFSALRIAPRRILLVPFAAFFIAYGLTCVALVFIVAFALGGPGSLSPRSMRMCFALASGVGLIAALLAQRRHAPPPVLSIDTARRTLSFVGPRSSAHVRFDDLAHWTLHWVLEPPNQNSDDDSNKGVNAVLKVR